MAGRFGTELGSSPERWSAAHTNLGSTSVTNGLCMGTMMEERCIGALPMKSRLAMCIASNDDKPMEGVGGTEGVSF